MKLAKKVTALIAATGLTLSLSLALLTGCSKATSGEPAIQQDVIVATIEGAPGHSVDFKAVSPQGTNAVTVCPFQNLQLLKQGLGFNWSGAALKFGSAYTFTSELNSDGSAAWTLQE